MNYNNFFTIEVPEMMKKLTPTTPALWGQMTALEMLDHLRIGIELSLDSDPERIIITPEDQIPSYQTFLMSEKPFGKNLPMPDAFRKFPKKNSDIDRMKIDLLKGLVKMLTYFERFPDHRAIHPNFGMLTAAQWRHLHKKHIDHHFRQFGILEL